MLHSNAAAVWSLLVSVVTEVLMSGNATAKGKSTKLLDKIRTAKNTSEEAKQEVDADNAKHAKTKQNIHRLALVKPTIAWILMLPDQGVFQSRLLQAVIARCGVLTIADYSKSDSVEDLRAFAYFVRKLLKRQQCGGVFALSREFGDQLLQLVASILARVRSTAPSAAQGALPPILKSLHTSLYKLILSILNRATQEEPQAEPVFLSTCAFLLTNAELIFTPGDADSDVRRSAIRQRDSVSTLSSSEAASTLSPVPTSSSVASSPSKDKDRALHASDIAWFVLGVLAHLQHWMAKDPSQDEEVDFFGFMGLEAKEKQAKRKQAAEEARKDREAKRLSKVEVPDALAVTPPPSSSSLPQALVLPPKPTATVVPETAAEMASKATAVPAGPTQMALKVGRRMVNSLEMACTLVWPEAAKFADQNAVGLWLESLQSVAAIATYAFDGSGQSKAGGGLVGFPKEMPSSLSSLLAEAAGTAARRKAFLQREQGEHRHRSQEIARSRLYRQSQIRKRWLETEDTLESVRGTRTVCWHRLDLSEGPFRERKKMIRDADFSEAYGVDMGECQRLVKEKQCEAISIKGRALSPRASPSLTSRSDASSTSSSASSASLSSSSSPSSTQASPSSSSKPPRPNAQATTKPKSSFKPLLLSPSASSTSLTASPASASSSRLNDADFPQAWKNAASPVRPAHSRRGSTGSRRNSRRSSGSRRISVGSGRGSTLTTGKSKKTTVSHKDKGIGSDQITAKAEDKQDTNNTGEKEKGENGKQDKQRRKKLNSPRRGGEEEEESEEDGEEETAAWRSLKKLLQPGLEAPIDMFNCHRMDGLEARAALLLFFSDQFYVIDDFTLVDGQPEEMPAQEEKFKFRVSPAYGQLGDVVEKASGTRTREGSEGLLLNVTRLDTQRWGTVFQHRLVRQWDLKHLKAVFTRKYLLQDVALEFFSRMGANSLLVFQTKKERNAVLSRLQSSAQKSDEGLLHESYGDTLSSLPSRSRFSFGGGVGSVATKWAHGQLSNYAYLIALNTLAGRSYNDLTQYPVFPWVLSNYHTDTLDLHDASNFRDLSKPMGAVNPDRAAEFQSRYEEWQDDEIPPFHYGSHYSSSGTVLFYLMRMLPFTKVALQHQGGYFDVADRLFGDVAMAWHNASGEPIPVGYMDGPGDTGFGLQDVKELIPEWYSQPDLFVNHNRFNLGRTQTGQSVHDVTLPPWAAGDARIFVRIMRLALESDLVSEGLNNWIDLIFGCKQKGKAAVEACNVFYYLTYSGAVDIESIKDPMERRAIISQIGNFGETPEQLFKRAHTSKQTVSNNVDEPESTEANPDDEESVTSSNTSRNVHPRIGSRASRRQKAAGTVASRPDLLKPLLTPVRLPGHVTGLSWDGAKLWAVGPHKVLVPGKCPMYLSFAWPAYGLTMCSGSAKDTVLFSHERVHDDPISTVHVTDTGLVVSGSIGGSVAMHQLKADALVFKASFCSHSRRVTCVASSTSWQQLVTGAADGTVLTWDLNRFKLVRSLPKHPAAISSIAMDDLTGDIATACGQSIYVWDINGSLLVGCNTSWQSLIRGSVLSNSTQWREDVIRADHRDAHSTVAKGGEEERATKVLTPSPRTSSTLAPPSTARSATPRSSRTGSKPRGKGSGGTGKASQADGRPKKSWGAGGGRADEGTGRASKPWLSPSPSASRLSSRLSPRLSSRLSSPSRQRRGDVASLAFASAVGSDESWMLLAGLMDGRITCWSLQFSSLTSRRGHPPPCPLPLPFPPACPVSPLYPHPMYLHLHQVLPASNAGHTAPVHSIVTSHKETGRFWSGDAEGEIREWTVVDDRRTPHPRLSVSFRRSSISMMREQLREGRERHASKESEAQEERRPSHSQLPDIAGEELFDRVTM